MGGGRYLSVGVLLIFLHTDRGRCCPDGQPDRIIIPPEILISATRASREGGIRFPGPLHPHPSVQIQREGV
ncbi:hypothetical protein AB205_0147900 [Aquarana catesbeiana]|uniref:Secreted protein n=1 Tax=Aquarana catesbeiana TaxID=8400 RepID=A0A2G9Q269_AQUCT|nr:hypothetical protein AB205_0147900 [Aquarana catesbeiana]